MKNIPSYQHPIMIGILFLAFMFNGGIAPSKFFKFFQKDSELLVIHGIEGARLGHAAAPYLGYITTIDPEQSQNSSNPSPVNPTPANADKQFTPYMSQFGLQGLFFSKISIALNWENTWGLRMLCATLLALTIVAMTKEYEKLSPGLGWCLYFSLLLSPWIVSFARNLYWVTFTWFTPALFTLYMHNTKYSISKILFSFLIFASFLAKFLCGYEYTSSIILFAAMPYVYSFIFAQNEEKKTCTKFFFATCLLGVSGFTVALLIHANVRGDTLLEGLKSIYNQDVLRRTYGDPANFGEVYTPALLASPLAVVKSYIASWPAGPLPFISKGIGRFTVFTLPLILITYKTITAGNRKLFARLLPLLAYSFLIPVSWFILAKGHSYNHPHTNYALWYMGFTQISMFVIYVFASKAYIITTESHTIFKEVLHHSTVLAKALSPSLKLHGRRFLHGMLDTIAASSLRILKSLFRKKYF